VPFNEKWRITERINARLTDEGISTIEIELVGWRMSRVIGNLKYAEGAYVFTKAANLYDRYGFLLIHGWVL
jgi:hypothetical protein